MRPIFALEDAGFSIRGKPLLREACLALEPGQVTIIIGPNGAGKSTLLKLITGEVTPTTGLASSFGQPLASVPAWRLAARRAVMAQASRLSFPFPVHDIVRLGTEGIGRAASRVSREAIVSAALEAADLSSLAGRDYQSLSGGEQQRVQFARVLAQLDAGASIEPVQALFLDEPIASLDLCHQLALLDAARDLVRDRGIALLAILHDLNLAATYADRLVAMDHGRIVASGTPTAVLTGALLAETFGVRMQRHQALPETMPFLLPQLCERISGG